VGAGSAEKKKASKARTALGFEPKVTMDDGMARVQRWARAEGLIR
jgi:nucleoside-diphosphate-sugar epimerase